MISSNDMFGMSFWNLIYHKMDNEADVNFMVSSIRKQCLSIFSTTRSYRPGHYDVIRWKHFPRNWPFCAGNSLVPENSPHKGQRRGALMFSLICVWINGWGNNHEAGDLRRHRGHNDVNVMWRSISCIVRTEMSALAIASEVWITTCLVHKRLCQWKMS